MYKWKKSENLLTFGKDIDNKKVAQFFLTDSVNAQNVNFPY